MSAGGMGEGRSGQENSGGGNQRPVGAGAKIGDRRVSQAAIDLIRGFEGFSSVVYDDAAGFPTIGYGHLIKRGERLERVTRDEAEILLRRDLKVACSTVEKSVMGLLTDAQHGALVSLVFNIGSGNFRRSTLLRLLNKGDYEGAANEFPNWRKAGGKVLRGLVRRRAAEQEMFNG